MTNENGLVKRIEAVLAMNRRDKTVVVPRDLLLECRAAVIARDLLANIRSNNERTRHSD